MDAHTAWAELRAVPYPPYALGELTCSRCGESLPEETYWMVVASDGDPELVRLVDEGRLNLVECAVCGETGVLDAPVLWIEGDRGILVYDTFVAPEPEHVVRADMLAMARELDGFPTEALTDNTLTVRNLTELHDFRELDEEFFALAREGMRLREERMGVFGAERVGVICRDIDRCPIFFISDYERSVELLGKPELWQGEQAREIWETLAGRIHPDDETVAPAAEPTLTPSSREDFDAVIADAERYFGDRQPDDLLIPERAVAVLLDAEITLTPEETARFREAAADWNDQLEPLARMLQLFPRPSGAEPPSERSKDGLRHMFGTLGGGPWRRFTWTTLDVADPADGLPEAVEAYTEGRYEEALERAIIAERSSAPEERRLCALYTAMLSLACRRPYGRNLAELAKAGTIDHVTSTGRAEINELTALAHVQRMLGDAEDTRGQYQAALHNHLTAFDLYLSLEDWGWLADMGPGLILSLFSFERTAEAMEIINLLFTDEIINRIRPDELVQLYGALAAALMPLLEIGYTPGDSTINVVDPAGLLDQRDPAIPEGSSLLIKVGIPGFDGRAHTLIVGNAGLNALVRLLASALDPERRLRVLLAIAHAEVHILGDRPSDTISAGLLRTMQDLVTTALEAAGSASSRRAAAEVAAAFGQACQLATTLALQADAILAEGGPDELEQLAGALWGYALGTGAPAADLDLVLERSRERTTVDYGALTEIVLTAYALALETAGQLDEAISLYLERLPSAEKRRSVFSNRSLTLWAQASMTAPYIRLSRCLYAHHLATGDLSDALLAADALERHRARELRDRGIALTGTVPAGWLVAPLGTAAGKVPLSDAVACLGVHTYTRRIAGRWMAVGMRGGQTEPAWTHQTTPPDLLYEIYAWFSDRMQQATQAVRAARVTTMEEFTAVLEQHVPANAFQDHLTDLWRALGVSGGPIAELHLSAEDYALQLPWSAAALTADDEAPVVRLLPTTALIGRPTRPYPEIPLIVIGVQDDRPTDENAQLMDAAGDLAESVAAHLSGSEADIGLFPQTDLPESDPADVLILFGHGRRGQGMSHVLHTFDDPPRTVVLLGCWSAHLVQDLSHREVEGLAVSLLAAGAETVVASLWPVTFDVGARFVAAYLSGVLGGVAPGPAFAAARAELRAEFTHPALWAGFTLFG